MLETGQNTVVCFWCDAKGKIINILHQNAQTVMLCYPVCSVDDNKMHFSGQIWENSCNCMCFFRRQIGRFLYQSWEQFQFICPRNISPNNFSAVSLSGGSSWSVGNQDLHLSPWCCWKICVSQFSSQQSSCYAHV